MKNSMGKIRKYAVVITFIVAFLALWLALKSTAQWPIVLIVNLSMFTILTIDIIDAAIKAANGKQVAIVRHVIGLLFIFPVLITLHNKDYKTNLIFVAIILYAYDIYTFVFYLATLDYDMLKSKKALIRGFLLDTPPKIIIAIMCDVISRSADDKIPNKKYNNEVAFDLNTLSSCEKVSLICFIIYSVLLFLFILLDIFSKNNKIYKKDFVDYENKNPEEF